jgi:hypothetical protein
MTPSEPGGIELYRLTTSTTTTNNNTSSSSSDLLLTSGAYVASDVGVNIRTELQASNSMKKSSVLWHGTLFTTSQWTGNGRFCRVRLESQVRAQVSWQTTIGSIMGIWQRGVPVCHTVPVWPIQEAVGEEEFCPVSRVVKVSCVTLEEEDA